MNMVYTEVFTSIMGKSSFGLLIDLGIQNFVPIDQAIMYYNYIAIFFVVGWAMFASQSNESRYLFTTPLMAALMVWVGWLHATDATQYWGSILFCMVLGAIMYINDMNHEKFGLAGPGDKLVALAVMIICFTASFGFIASSQFGMFSGDSSSGSSQNVMCGRAYTCDSSGNVALEASVSSVNNSGGLGLDVVSILATLGLIAVTLLKLIIVVFGSVLFFSVVVLAAYPALADSPQTIAFLAVFNVVIWIIYATAIFRLYYKPVGTGGDV